MSRNISTMNTGTGFDSQRKYVDRSKDFTLKVNVMDNNGTRPRRPGCGKRYEGDKLCGLILFYLPLHPVQLCPECLKDVEAVKEYKDNRAKAQRKAWDRKNKKEYRMSSKYIGEKVWTKHGDGEPVLWKSKLAAAKGLGITAETIRVWLKNGGSENRGIIVWLDGKEPEPLAAGRKYGKPIRVTIGDVVKEFQTNIQVAEFFSVCNTTVARWASGRNPAPAGYKIEYIK